MADREPIVSRVCTIDELFRSKYKLASYQRDYTWSRAEILALINDLSRRFRSQWRSNDGYENVEDYEPYFLGSIVYYRESGFQHLVDGQQRVTTLHLLLIFLKRLLEDQDVADHAAAVHNLIWSNRGRTFTLHVDERTQPLKAIMEGADPALGPDASVSLRNLMARYADIREHFPHDLRNDALEYFVHWLLYRVCVVGIEAESKHRGWEIFETTNDRGVKLGPVDLLKSHLVGKATKTRQPELSKQWSDRMGALAAIEKQAPSQFMKDLIVGKYLDDLGDESIRDATVAMPLWVRENDRRLGLEKPGDYADFVAHTVLHLAGYYENLRRAIDNYHPDQGWARVAYVNQHNGIPYHLAAVLAALRPTDGPAAFHEKTRLIGAYLDLLYVRRLVNRRAMRVESLTRPVLNLILRLRGCAEVADVRGLLQAETAQIKETFKGVARFSLNPDSRGQVRYLLARMTAFMETGVSRPDELSAYLDPGGRFDIEHIVPNNLDRFRTETGDRTIDEQKFMILRERVGALLLLPKSDNSSIGEVAYQERIDLYRRQNMLAATLHKSTRQSNPDLKRFLHEHTLDKLCQPIPDRFGVAAVDTRQELYRRLCELIWDPVRLGLASEQPRQTAPEPSVRDSLLPPKPAAPAAVVPTPNTAMLAKLVSSKRLSTEEDLVGIIGDEEYRARVLPDGRVMVLDETFPDLTAAGNFVRNKQTRGWDFWRVRREGKWVKVGSLRPEK
jgi:Protein of unknown function DUF262/Protein of unknown function (DUF1524)